MGISIVLFFLIQKTGLQFRESCLVIVEGNSTADKWHIWVEL